MSTALEKVNRLKAQLQNIKEEAKQAAKIGVSSTLVVGGGAAAGLLAAKMPYLPRTTVPTAGAVGSGLILLAMSGVLDEHADNAAMVGAGMLAAVAARESEKLFKAA
jgi:hypothetical protein